MGIAYDQYIDMLCFFFYTSRWSTNRECQLTLRCRMSNYRSFGHHAAREFKVNEGFTHLPQDGAQNVKLGFCLTRQSVLKVRMCTSLLRYNICLLQIYGCIHFHQLDTASFLWILIQGYRHMKSYHWMIYSIIQL
jgi:hypothetical protein